MNAVIAPCWEYTYYTNNVQKRNSNAELYKIKKLPLVLGNRPAAAQ